jgi:hypothetical protein
LRSHHGHAYIDSSLNGRSVAALGLF